MIVYNQAFDINHAIFRITSLLSFYKGESLEIERLRIWDFYLAFPREVSNIRFGNEKEDNEVKKLFPKKDNPYEVISNPNKLFGRMQPYQLIAIKTLASYGVINKDYFQLNRITKVNKDLLTDYLKENASFSERELNIIKIMTSYFNFMPLYGTKGLKSRTNLLEYKYDAQ